jgi:hypothetical protein
MRILSVKGEVGVESAKYLIRIGRRAYKKNILFEDRRVY